MLVCVKNAAPYLTLNAFSSLLSLSKGMTLNSPSYRRSPMQRHWGSMMPRIPVSEGRPIRSCQTGVPWFSLTQKPSPQPITRFCSEHHVVPSYSLYKIVIYIITQLLFRGVPSYSYNKVSPCPLLCSQYQLLTDCSFTTV